MLSSNGVPLAVLSYVWGPDVEKTHLLPHENQQAKLTTIGEITGKNKKTPTCAVKVVNVPPDAPPLPLAIPPACD